MTRHWRGGEADADLARIAKTDHLLVALDFDGTAAPLVDIPMQARALPAVAEQVARLAALPRTTVAYVSGRSLGDLRVIAEHDDASPVALAGSHGAEYWFPGQGVRERATDEAAGALRATLSDRAAALIDSIPDVYLEEKAFGFAVHTRRATGAEAARAFALVDGMMAVDAPHWRRREGHDVVEFSYRAEGKDTAIDVLRRHFRPTAVLFAGDDVTDEDAIRALGPMDLGVRVGSGESAASIRVASPQQIAELLSAVATSRERRPE